MLQGCHGSLQQAETQRHCVPGDLQAAILLVPAASPLHALTCAQVFGSDQLNIKNPKTDANLQGPAVVVICQLLG